MHYLEKELYERISKSDIFFDYIQNSVLDGIWYWDLEKPLNNFVSAGFYKGFGYETNEELPQLNHG